MRYGILIDLTACTACGACVMACKMQNGTQQGTYWCTVLSKEVGTYPNSSKRVLPIGCQHCTKAPCVEHCPTGASYYTGDGTVLINSEKCIGCRLCMNVCPYHARTFNEADPEKNPYFAGFDLTPFEKVHAADHPTGVVEKCVHCYERIKQEKEPACVQTCITKCRTFGDLDDPDSEISRKIREGNAWQLLPEYGTDPNFYYIGQF